MPKDGLSRKQSSNSSNNILNLPKTRPVTPGSEQRKRKSLLIQKQREAVQQAHLHVPDLGGSSSWNKGGSSMQSSSSTTSERQSFLASMEIDTDHSKSSSESSAENQYDGSCRSRHGRRRPFNTSSPRFRRSVTVFAFVLVFCLLVLFREGEEEESILRKGNQMEEDQEERDIDIARHGSSSHEDISTTTSSQDAVGHSTMQPTSEQISPAPKPLETSPTHSSSSSPAASPISKPSSSSDPTSTTPHTNVDADNAAIGTSSNFDSALQQPEQENEETSGGTIASTGEPEEPAASSLPPDLLQTLTPQKTDPPIISRPNQQYQTKAPHDPSSMSLQEPLLPLDTSNDNSFVQRYCDLQGSDWFPLEKDATFSQNNATKQQPQKSWRQRAPFVMLVGPSHGGSDVLWQLLATHPQIADATKSQFFTFNYKLFARTNSNPIQQQQKSKNATSSSNVRIKTRAARQAYMARHIAAQRPLQKNPSQIVLDSVPDTLLYSQKFAPFVMCVMPWVKLVISVSHPIRRLLRHYQAAQQRGLPLSLEDWIARDLERMQQAGVLQGMMDGGNNNHMQQAVQSLPDHDAWVRYQELTPTAMDAPVGQSLYEFMVHPWFATMEEMGRNPTSEIVVVQREALVPTTSKTSTPEAKLIREYQRILKRLGLTKHSPPTALVQHIVAQQQQELQMWKTQLDDSVRKQLKNFFAPYNVFFDQFLKRYYEGEAGDTTVGSELLLNWKPELWRGG